MLGSLILYLKGMRRMMFQLSGFYYKSRQPQTTCINTSFPYHLADPTLRLQSSSFWGSILESLSKTKGGQPKRNYFGALGY